MFGVQEEWREIRLAPVNEPLLVLVNRLVVRATYSPGGKRWSGLLANTSDTRLLEKYPPTHWMHLPRGPGAGGWWNVKMKLPDNNDQVLVYTTASMIEVGYYESRWCPTVTDRCGVPFVVLHWRTIPKPPATITLEDRAVLAHFAYGSELKQRELRKAYSDLVQRVIIEVPDRDRRRKILEHIERAHALTFSKCNNSTGLDAV